MTTQEKVLSDSTETITRILGVDVDGNIYELLPMIEKIETLQGIEDGLFCIAGMLFLLACLVATGVMEYHFANENNKN